MDFYKHKIEKIYELLQTSEHGLASTEAVRRLEQYGRNELVLKQDPWWRVVLEPFKSIFVAVLGAAALVSGISGELWEALIVVAIIFVNAGIFYTQHFATTRVLRALREKRVTRVTVLRDGVQQELSAPLLVPGDIVLLSEGEKVPADARVVAARNARVNEASLTGESVPVSKHPAHHDVDRELYEQDNMVFQGSYVVAGEVRALIVATGVETQFGRIASLATGEQDESPLQKKINQLIAVIVKVTFATVLVVFLLALARDIPAQEALRFVLSLSVSAVPEGLPVALTVIFVFGMRRMAKRQVLVRSFKAIEDIGLITTIATDKTGTLTKNHLSVVDSWSTEGSVDIGEYAAKTIDMSEKLSDPLDIAISETAGAQYASPAVIYPFDLALRMSGAYDSSSKTIYIKGSPEHVLAKSTASSTVRREAESAMHELAARGYRVIALATHKTTSPPKDLSAISRLHFVGFLAFADELRPEASRAIKAATKAGITVRLITGDHFETAFNIGKTLGIAAHPDEVIQGHDLPKDAQALAVTVQGKRVFARILPEDKYRILQALKEQDITAMTGDGVNDVPAIANAHVGIAMGSGSDIARDAGGMILLDDNFSSIVAGISEGRRIYDNIRRMLFYLLSTTIGEVSITIGSLLLGLPLPLTAIQILWINLVTDTAMALPLGLEPEEKGHMLRAPRPPKAPLLQRFMVVRLILVATTIAATNLILVAILHNAGHSDAYIQTVMLFSIVAAQWMNALNARSESESIVTRLRVRNRPLIVGFAIAIFLQWLVLFGPLGGLFHVEPVDLSVYLASFAFVGLSVLVVVELHKLYMRVRR